MKYTLRFLSVAESDLGDVLAYLSADNPKASRDMLSKFEECFELLADNPMIGRAPREQSLNKLGYRYWTIGNHLIFYVIHEKTVVIHRVIHGARSYLDLL